MTLWGLRHECHLITRTKTIDNISVTATINYPDVVSVDGDYSGLTPVPSATSGPEMTDRKGTSQLVTNWVWTSIVLPFIWNRSCTHDINWQVTYPQLLPTQFDWSGSVGNYFENVSITRDGGTAKGPFSDLQLLADYGILCNLNSGADDH